MKILTGKLIGNLVFIATVGFVTPCSGSAIQASNAGPLPSSAQDLTGFYANEITGSLTFPNGVNTFKILIYNPSAFSARTTHLSFAVPDTELFLFDANGFGVYANDDMSASNTLSCLPSSFANPRPTARGDSGPGAAGVYYLAITRSANSALSPAGNIFSFLSSTAVAGPDLSIGGGRPISSWDNAINAGPDFDLIRYDIVLTGTTPEPASWLLTASGLALLSLAWIFSQALGKGRCVS